jgi:hypothetical protein
MPRREMFFHPFLRSSHNKYYNFSVLKDEKTFPIRTTTLISCHFNLRNFEASMRLKFLSESFIDLKLSYYARAFFHKFKFLFFIDAEFELV